MHWHVFIRTKRPLNITTRNICNRIYTSPKPLRCKANITSYYWEQIIGILRIFPEQLQKSSYVPPIVFTGLKIQGASQDLDIDDLKELKLKPSERNVTFQFAALVTLIRNPSVTLIV